MVRIADCATAESGTNSSSRLSKASTKYSQLCSGRVRWRFPKPFRCAPTYFALGSSTLRTLPRQSEIEVPQVLFRLSRWENLEHAEEI